ncbi:hypothetical protein BJX99DRAFT_224490 [Aspergillus californicus]
MSIPPRFGQGCYTYSKSQLLPFQIKGVLDRRQLHKSCETLIHNSDFPISVYSIPSCGQSRHQSRNSRYLAIRTHSPGRVHTLQEIERSKYHPTRPLCGYSSCERSQGTFPCSAHILRPVKWRLSAAIGKVLNAAYNNKPLHIAPTFADYVRTCVRRRTPAALDYWSDLVAGSEMSFLPRVSEGNETTVLFPMSARLPPLQESPLPQLSKLPGLGSCIGRPGKQTSSSASLVVPAGLTWPVQQTSLGFV